MIIRDATLLDFHDLSQRSGTHLRIRDGRIAELGRGVDLAPEEGEQIIDA